MPRSSGPGRHRGELAAQDLRPSFLAPTGSSRDARGGPLQRVGVSAEPTMGTMPASASERADTLRGIDRSRPRRWRVVVGHGQSSVMRWSSTSSLPSGATSPHFVGDALAVREALRSLSPHQRASSRTDLLHVLAWCPKAEGIADPAACEAGRFIVLLYFRPTTEQRYTSSVTLRVISGWAPAAAARTCASETNW